MGHRGSSRCIVKIGHTERVRRLWVWFGHTAFRIFFRYESAILVVLYIIYILLMYFNRFLEKKSNSAVERLKKKYIKKEKLKESDNVSEERQPLSSKMNRKSEEQIKVFT